MRSNFVVGVVGVVLGISISLVSIEAMAHGGATGLVKERMDGMKDMKSAMKSVADMFRGRDDYDPAAVREAAAVIEKHSGEDMTRLFPQGSIHGPSEARPEIWQEWDRFDALARQLRRYSQALGEVADGGAGGFGDAKGFMEHRGGMGMMSGMGPSDEHLASMPAGMIFEMMVDNCSSCHDRYRIED